MRSSLFGFIELILLIGLILFYHTIAYFTTQRRKVNLGRIPLFLIKIQLKMRDEPHTRC